MTTNQLGSKLANSVRRAKAQQTEQDKPAAAAEKTNAPEAALPIIPSRRVWPD